MPARIANTMTVTTVLIRQVATFLTTKKPTMSTTKAKM